jgi:error-prone DNA polymerase
VESRAQMNMLPRLKPREFYDLVIRLPLCAPARSRAIWFTPICAAAMARRWCFPTCPAARPRQVLGKTLGVPLFQEQAMKIAMVAAEFTPEQANGCAAPWRRSAGRHDPGIRAR